MTHAHQHRTTLLWPRRRTPRVSVPKVLAIFNSPTSAIFRSTMFQRLLPWNLLPMLSLPMCPASLLDCESETSSRSRMARNESYQSHKCPRSPFKIYSTRALDSHLVTRRPRARSLETTSRTASFKETCGIKIAQHGVLGSIFLSLVVSSEQALIFYWEHRQDRSHGTDSNARGTVPNEFHWIRFFG